MVFRITVWCKILYYHIALRICIARIVMIKKTPQSPTCCLYLTHDNMANLPTHLHSVGIRTSFALLALIY